MFDTTETFANANKSSIDALFAQANALFASAERLTALNMSTVRSMVEENALKSKAVLGAKDLPEFFVLQSALAQPNVKKAFDYSNSVYKISAQTQEAFTKVTESQIAEARDNVASIIDKAAKSSPVGSDVWTATINSAIATASMAKDSFKVDK